MPDCIIRHRPSRRVHALRLSRRTAMDARIDRHACDASAARSRAAARWRRARRPRARLSALYGRTSAKLYGICLRLLGSEAEAQDALQEAYVTVWRKAGAFDPAQGERRSPGWRSSRATRRSTGCGGESCRASRSTRRPTSPMIAPRRSTWSQQEPGRGAPARCLDELEEKPRAMIRAAFLDGASYPELAEREGVPLGTMKSWIRRGLLRLRGCLER